MQDAQKSAKTTVKHGLAEFRRAADAQRKEKYWIEKVVAVTVEKGRAKRGRNKLGAHWKAKNKERRY